MAKDRFNPAARRALGTLSGDPMDALVRETMARRDAETFNPRELRTDALAPQYDAMSEMDPYEPEPDGDADDYDMGQTDIRLRDGRMMEPGEALGFNGSPAGIVGQSNYLMRGYTPDSQRVNMADEIARLRMMRGER